MKAIKFFAAALVATLALSCNAQKSNVKVDVELPSAATVDSVSYLLGVNFGSFIKGNNFAEDMKELNAKEMIRGMQDFLKAEGTPYDPAFGEQFDIDPNTMNQILSDYIMKKQNYKAAVNAVEGKEFLAKNAKRADVDTTASGLQYTIIAAGADEKISPNDTVWVNYKGTLIDGTVFDENHSEEGIEFVANRVIRGWTEGLGLVGEGGKLVLYIPSDLAYGERGNQAIAPNSVLVFDVEVLKVGKYNPAE
ncbi:MAG: FKBP-type peptidyl-prolyl cis-trans isomerase [Bacteroidales bacterium]|nr:FKBP-type peptidyl-prolyl cis-trans isomerase [Bacteroidales bacterium]